MNISSPSHIQTRPRRHRGQGMTEYIIIVALIAVAGISVFQLFGNTLRNQTAALANEMAGEDGQPSINAAGSAAAKASTQATTDRSLSTYGGQANDGNAQ
jgi:Flp pilus assembly pilin Flp